MMRHVSVRRSSIALRPCGTIGRARTEAKNKRATFGWRRSHRRRRRRTIVFHWVFSKGDLDDDDDESAAAAAAAAVPHRALLRSARPAHCGRRGAGACAIPAPPILLNEKGPPPLPLGYRPNIALFSRIDTCRAFSYAFRFFLCDRAMYTYVRARTRSRTPAHPSRCAHTRAHASHARPCSWCVRVYALFFIVIIFFFFSENMPRREVGEGRVRRGRAKKR